MIQKGRKPAVAVYINSESIGAGDDALGTLLMGNFLSTLGDFVPQVSHILLVNSGVKLVCEGSDKSELMSMLEESGVEILSCGTCINHFSLKDKIKAGKISNMFSILEVMTDAEKVLTP